MNTVTRYRKEGDMSRRRLIRSCMNLARAYERAARYSDAAAMYGYVIANGGSLGLVAEATAASASLPTEAPAAPAPESEEN